MKYLEKSFAVYPGAQKVELSKPCDHIGRKRIFNSAGWQCECGVNLTEIDNKIDAFIHREMRKAFERMKDQ